MTSNAYEGIRAKHLDRINAKYLCAVCSILLDKPHQLLCCGTLVCEGCLADQQPFICPSCKARKLTREAQFDRAVDCEMKTISIECFNCKWTGIFSDYIKHLQTKHNDFHCDQCNERFFSKNAYRQHQLETCTYRCVSCGLPNCETSIKYNEMREHYLTNKHQDVLHKTITKFGRKKRADYRSINEMCRSIGSTTEILQNELVRIKTTFGQERTNLDKNKLEIDQLKIVQKQLDEQSFTNINNLTNMQTRIEQIKQPDISILDSNLSTIFARNYPVDTIISTFQTSSYGYIFSVRLSTTSIKDTQYLSLIVNLLNGDYNNILPFPFTYNIHFTLCDQSSQHDDFLYILKPDQHSSSFIRPISEKNEDIHISNFCLMETLNSKYVRDGKFFLRISVDFLRSE